MSNLRPFQVVLFAIFGAMGIGALVLLGAYQASVNQNAKAYGDYVEVWGTLDKTAVDSVRTTILGDIEAFTAVEYRQIEGDAYIETIVDAIAEGRSPDLLILSSEDMVTLRSKLLPLTYDIEGYDVRTFRNTYIDGAEIFTFPEGIYAVPLAVDPLLQYWNRDLFATAGLAKAPGTWEEVINRIVPSLTVYDTRRTILQSALAFGEFRNVTNAKAIIMALAMQSGSQMVYLGDNGYEVGLNLHIDSQTRELPLQNAVSFFTNFSNANSPLYSWNRVQPSDKNAFLAGELATYYGFTSEYQDIVSKNPNLNFDAVPVPQGSTATIRRTYGNFYGLAIPKAAANPQGAFAAINTMTSGQYAALYADALGLVPVRRDAVEAGTSDPVLQTAYNTALIARGWLDPNPSKTSGIMETLIEGVVSNRVRVDQAVDDAVVRISQEF